MQPETAIESWRHWQGALRTRPQIVAPLGGGRSNRSFLLDSNGIRMVLRLNHEDPMLPGINRSSEAEIWRAASDEGIAPALLHADEQAGFLVSAFIENQLPARAQANEAVLERVFDLLERCHLLDVNAPTLDYSRQIENYCHIIAARGGVLAPSLYDQRKPMHKLVEALDKSDAPAALCHHDPVVANFVGSPESLHLTDWEYAARGLAVMDYAALGVEWGIDDAIIAARTETNPELLQAARNLYLYLCALWQEAINF